MFLATEDQGTETYGDRAFASLMHVDYGTVRHLVFLNLYLHLLLRSLLKLFFYIILEHSVVVFRS